MAKVAWSVLAASPSKSHLLIATLPADEAENLHRGEARAIMALLIRLCGKLGVGTFAIAVSRAGSRTEIQCLFTVADDARRMADKLQARSTEAGPWASCWALAFDDDAHRL